MTASGDRPIDPYEDRRRRFLPSKAAVEAATTALSVHPDAEAAVVPMYMPGKQYNMWAVGQRVETIELGGEDVLLAFPGTLDGSLPTVRQRCEEAHGLATAALAEHGRGTTAYAVVRRDGTAMVFEEILSAR